MAASPTADAISPQQNALMPHVFGPNSGVRLRAMGSTNDLAMARVRELLDRVGISQRTIAKRMGLSDSWFSRWLNGDGEITLDVVAWDRLQAYERELAEMLAGERSVDAPTALTLLEEHSNGTQTHEVDSGKSAQTSGKSLELACDSSTGEVNIAALTSKRTKGTPGAPSTVAGLDLSHVSGDPVAYGAKLLATGSNLHEAADILIAAGNALTQSATAGAEEQGTNHLSPATDRRADVPRERRRPPKSANG